MYNFAIVGLQSANGDEINVFLLVVGLLGGLAIFLLGMERMTESLKLVAGDRLRALLLRLTSSRFAGLATGAGITAVIQSSSVTTVLVVGFITSGLMTFEQSIGVILGANIGTTITAQIIAFKVTTYALLGVAVGFGLSFFSKSGARKAQGDALLGLGLVFFGMTIMGDAMEPLRSSEAFIDVMARLENPLLGAAIGALFTALVQSSSATTGIVIVLAQQGLINIDSGIALILGANVGTSVTALLAAIGKPREALRASMAHTIFNVGGVLLWLPLVGVLGSMVSSIGGGTAREIANAHSVFNVVNALLVIGFAPQFARLVERLVKDRPDEIEEAIRAKYLDRELIRTPALALDRARLELLRMADRAREMMAQILPAILRGDRWTLLEIQALDDEVDGLHGHIIGYLGQISEARLTEQSTQELFDLMEATNDLESIGDLIETNMVNLGLARIEQGLSVSAATAEMLEELHAAVAESLDLSMMALAQKNADAARRVGNMKNQINSMERAAAAHEASRLMADAPDRIAHYRFEIDVIASLKRIYYFTKRIARVSVPDEEKAAMTEN
ncbi:MAG: Na/Pi cotransporter family protein [Acidimicrobiia bacterium]|nr:Na/Pi cotransporter family protein [Acidimicrobiia bacterium]